METRLATAVSDARLQLAAEVTQAVDDARTEGERRGRLAAEADAVAAASEEAAAIREEMQADIAAQVEARVQDVRQEAEADTSRRVAALRAQLTDEWSQRLADADATSSKVISSLQADVERLRAQQLPQPTVRALAEQVETFA